MTVLIVDYGMGNLGSVRRALEECGATALVSDDPDDLAHASAIVLPGVGAFADGMRALRARAWPAALAQAVHGDGLPLLGICLGMQLLATHGEEGAPTDGLGLVPGRVVRMVAPDDERIPHVGWNEVWPTDSEAAGIMCAGIPPGSDFYFVHSYHFRPDDESDVAARTPYCGGVAAAVGRGKVWGTQFHPEKSSRAGFHLLRNFLLPG